MSRTHLQLVGPYPDRSCQLAFTAALFADVVPWWALQRRGREVFIHPITGHDLIDHRDRAICMGAVHPLALSVLLEQAV